MKRCFILLVVMSVSASEEKHLRIEDRMEVLTECQVLVGFGFCLRDLHILWMKVRALITLERLRLRSRRLMMRSEDGSVFMVEMTLMVLVGRSWNGRDVHSLIGQEEEG